MKQFSAGVTVLLILGLLLSVPWAAPVSTQDRSIDVDLLVVGGSDSAPSAAAQAARMGVKRIAVVNDIQWFGGQWGPGGLSGTLDELIQYRGRHAIFPRSGTELEIVRNIRDYNRKHFGVPSPGARAMTSSPMGAAMGFYRLIEPYTEKGTGQIQVLWPYQPVEVRLTGNRVSSVIFEHTQNPSDRLIVNAGMTIDASDWGDVVRRSGATYYAGPDPIRRFREVGALEELGERVNEMNSFSWPIVVTEAGRDATIPRPDGYDERQYYNATKYTVEEYKKLGLPDHVAYDASRDVFVERHDLGGTIGGGPSSFYTHRRAVDAKHNKVLPGVKDIVVISWRPTEDYPLDNFPKRVVDELEANEPGASKKNYVDMTYRQREIVNEDARRHALGFLYFLQTKIHEKTGDHPRSFKYMELFDEFGTSDKLPPKPYIREGLRMQGLYMVKRQDVDSGARGNAGWNWARHMFPDTVFSWQNWFDLHASERVFVNNDRSQPWVTAHRPGFDSTDGDRAGFPLRSLVPVERDGLIGSFINVGHSSIVSSAVRWHAFMPLMGQASGALAAIALRDDIQPREIARNWKLIREVQLNIVRPPDGSPGAVLWGFQDLQADGDLETDRLFLSANMLAVRAIMPGKKGSLDFDPYGGVTRRELAGVVARAARSLETAKPYHRAAKSLFTDVAANDPDRVYIDSLQHWGALEKSDRFRPDEPADEQTLATWMRALGWKVNPGLAASGAGRGGRRQSLPLWRWDLAVQLYAAIEELPEYFPNAPGYLTPGNDADGDGMPDLDDPLPLDRDNNNIPDRLDPNFVGA